MERSTAHAITDAGEVIIGSGSGSQLGAYAYAGGNVIFVVGQQNSSATSTKVFGANANTSVPREYVRMQGTGRPGSLLAKTLIIHNEAPAAPASSSYPRHSASRN